MRLVAAWQVLRGQPIVLKGMSFHPPLLQLLGDGKVRMTFISKSDETSTVAFVLSQAATRDLLGRLADLTA